MRFGVAIRSSKDCCSASAACTPEELEREQARWQQPCKHTLLKEQLALSVCNLRLTVLGRENMNQTFSYIPFKEDQASIKGPTLITARICARICANHTHALLVKTGQTPRNKIAAFTGCSVYPAIAVVPLGSRTVTFTYSNIRGLTHGSRC